MSSRRSSSACMQSQKFIPESQSHAQLSRILSTTCSKSSLSTSKSPLEPISFSCENIQGSSALLASELDKLIVVNSELTKEISSWKRKYQECFRLLRQNLPTDTEREDYNEIYKQKYTKLKGKALDLKKSYKILEGAVIEKNKEIGNWKDKYEQMEQEYIDQIQNLRNQIEVVLRSHIEKEVNIAMDELEKENGLREENWNTVLAKVKESQNEMSGYREERDRALRQLEDNAIEMRDLQKEVKFLDQEQEKTVKQLNLIKEQLSAKEVNCQSIQSKCTSLNAELEKLRTWTKEQTVEQNKAKQEVENLKVEKEAILKSFEQTKEQLKAAEVKYKEAQCKYILLSGEKLQGKEAKMNRLQEELNSVEKERDMLMGQLEDIKAELLVAQDKNSRVNQLEEVVKIVSQEKERVLSQLEERNRNSGEAEMRNNILKVEIETLRTLKDENITKINQLSNTLSSAKQEKETLSEENLALVEQKNKAVKQCEQTKGILSAVEKNYKNIYSSNVNLKTQVQSLEAAVSEKNTVLAQLEEAINTKTSEAYAKEIELKSQSEEIQLLREKIQSMNLELEALKTSQASNEGKTMAYLDEIKKREQTLKNLEGKVQSEMSQKLQLEKEISELKAIITSLEQQVEAIKKEKNYIIEQYEMKIQNINIEMEALRSSQATSEGKTMTYLEEIKRRDTALRNLENKIQSEMSQKASLEKEISELKTQHEKKILTELEGFRKNQAFDEGKILAYQEEIKKREQVLSTLESKVQVETSQKAQLEKEVSELKRVAGKKDEQCEALKKEKNLIIDQYEQKIQAQVERNSELVAKERQFRLKIDELSLRVNGNEELDKKVSSLLQENLTLRNGANEAQKVQSSLENKLKGLEIILDQLKSALEGEQEIGGMLRKIEEYKRNTVKMDGEFSMWRKKCEEQELRVVQEIEKVEAMWKRRMEMEVEGKNVMIRSKEEEITKERMEREIAIKSLELKLQTQASKLGENETERKTLLAMNENLNKQINQLVQELESVKKRQEEDMERESRLANTKLEIEREKRGQMEKEFSGIEGQLKQRMVASEEQAKVLKAKVEDFELRQVMYFIEIERLYAINGELIEDINRLTHELREASVELDKNKQIVMEISKAETFGNPQKDHFDEVASDLKKQIEGFEKKLQTHFDEKTEKPKFTSSMPLRLDDLIIDTPVKKIEGPSFTGTKMNKGQVSSIQKSHAELRDLAMKFESEKKTMEAQLAQFKKLVDMNKLEMKRFNESDAEYPMSNPLSPTVRFEGDQFEQPRQSLYGSQEWKVMPGSFNFPTRLTSDGKENTQQDGWPFMAKSASSSLVGFRSPQYQKGDDDYVMTPRVKLFK